MGTWTGALVAAEAGLPPTGPRPLPFVPRFVALAPPIRHDAGMSAAATHGADLPRARSWAVGAAFFTAGGLLSFSYRYLDVLTRARREPFHTKLVEELTGWWGVGLFILIPAVWLTRRLGGRSWPSVLAGHGLGLLAASAAHTSWNWGTRELAFRILRLGDYDYGILWLRYLMELPNDVILYAMCVGMIRLFDHYRDGQARTLRLARLEGELAGLRLRMLEAQLQPHFLFNALHTISSVMYEDVRAADRMLAGLSELLRRTLSRTDGHEVPLAEELAMLDLYLDIMRARFSDRLRVEVLVEPQAREGVVPALLLQPLVENALRHGDPGPDRPALVSVRARRKADRLELEVCDNGPGIRAGDGGGGLGLRITRSRLAELYPGEHLFHAGNGDGGGYRVALEIPFRAAPARA